MSNTDEHFRNHGFLLSSKGWTLSPAYDMNPNLNDRQNLLISSSSCESDLKILFNACEEYLMNKETATKIINEIINAMNGWKQLATSLGIAKREIDMFASKLDKKHTIN